jgi:galactokinase
VIQRFEAVERAFAAIWRDDPTWRAFVPGRLEVFGKHTDYAGGRSLVAAVPRGFVTAAGRASDGLVTAVDLASGDRFTSPTNGIATAGRGWHRYLLTVVHRLATNFPDTDLSARIVFESDLPSAAGISSSSALVVALAEALVGLARIDEHPAWTSTVVGIEGRAAYFGCIENGASFGALEGARGVGTHGGSEDHAAILASRAGCLQQFSFAPLRHDRSIALPAGWTFVIGVSGVRASKAGSARADYNRLADAVAAIQAEWRRQVPDDGRTLGEMVRDGDHRRLALPSHLRARLEHFVREDTRVLDAGDAFVRGDFAEVGALAESSQEDAETLLGNQVPETSALASLARALGASAASAFGAGWGGSVWALVKVADADAFLDRWLRDYRARYPHRIPKGFVSPPSQGVVRFGVR